MVMLVDVLHTILANKSTDLMHEAYLNCHLSSEEDRCNFYRQLEEPQRLGSRSNNWTMTPIAMPQVVHQILMLAFLECTERFLAC